MEKLESKFIEKEAFTVVGRRRTTPRGGGAWDIAKQDGSIQAMQVLQPGEPLLGLCFGFSEDGNDNMVAIRHDGEVEGLESFVFPAHQWVVLTLEDDAANDVLGNAWWFVDNKLLPDNKIKRGPFPTMEQYVFGWGDGNPCKKIEIHIAYVNSED